MFLFNTSWLLSSFSQSVFANESALMEMDEVITQIQLWHKRTSGSNQDNEAAPEESLHSSTYHSEAYDRIFGKEKGPESDGAEIENIPRSRKEIKYAPDEAMVAKVSKSVRI